MNPVPITSIAAVFSIRCSSPVHFEFPESGFSKTEAIQKIQKGPDKGPFCANKNRCQYPDDFFAGAGAAFSSAFFSTGASMGASAGLWRFSRLLLTAANECKREHQKQRGHENRDFFMDLKTSPIFSLRVRPLDFILWTYLPPVNTTLSTNRLNAGVPVPSKIIHRDRSPRNHRNDIQKEEIKDDNNEKDQGDKTNNLLQLCYFFIKIPHGCDTI